MKTNAQWGGMYVSPSTAMASGMFIDPDAPPTLNRDYSLQLLAPIP